MVREDSNNNNHTIQKRLKAITTNRPFAFSEPGLFLPCLTSSCRNCYWFAFISIIVPIPGVLRRLKRSWMCPLWLVATGIWVIICRNSSRVAKCKVIQNWNFIIFLSLTILRSLWCHFVTQTKTKRMESIEQVRSWCKNRKSISDVISFFSRLVAILTFMMLKLLNNHSCPNLLVSPIIVSCTELNLIITGQKKTASEIVVVINLVWTKTTNHLYP